VAFITLCVLKIAVLGALCYRAYPPFHKVVVNNKFVVAARKLATPSTTFRSRIYSSPRVKPAAVTDCSDSSVSRRQAAGSGRKWASERSEYTGSGASETGTTAVTVAAAATTAKQPATAAATAAARGSAGAAATAVTVHAAAAHAGDEAKLSEDFEHRAVVIVARRSTLKNRVIDFGDTI
jgi:hypothetical protein